ncbi:MAG: nicotinate-nucleotide adenylyltransferase [Firmicutes bacterium]|nr:nicotinate-nucleotide adenylyltransferase [Bacillota bacterium]
MKGQRIGIMGGTFDPIHYGHLVTAEAAREKYGLERVIFVPSGHPPHKDAREVTDFWHRYLMVLLAVVSNPYFEVSRMEYDRGGVTYTIDTVREFRRLYGAGTELFFITGADAILEILTWKQPEELLAMCRFIAATRPGYDLRQLNSLLGEFYQGAVSVLEIPMLSISSSDLRRRVKTGLSIKYLVPEPVEFYIFQNGLYREKRQQGL